jgi:hypothetical protein
LGISIGQPQISNTLYEQSMNSGAAIDETWESQGHWWHIRTWQDVIPTGTMTDPNSTMPGLWNVSLTATGPNSQHSFTWTSDGFVGV